MRQGFSCELMSHPGILSKPPSIANPSVPIIYVSVQSVPRINTVIKLAISETVLFLAFTNDHIRQFEIM